MWVGSGVSVGFGVLVGVKVGVNVGGGLSVRVGIGVNVSVGGTKSGPSVFVGAAVLASVEKTTAAVGLGMISPPNA